MHAGNIKSAAPGIINFSAGRDQVIGGFLGLAWLIVFIFSWVLFFIFVDLKRLSRTVWGGVIATSLGILVDWAGQRLGLYEFKEIIVSFAGSSIMHTFGPVFTMGILFFQHLSPDRRLQAANIIAFSLAYLAVEALICLSGAAYYIHWHYLASLGVDLLVFTSLSYAGEIIVLRKTVI